MPSLTTLAVALIVCGLLVVAAFAALLRSVLSAAVKRATEDSIDG